LFLKRLDKYRRPIRQHFRDALHHFGRIVSGAYNGIPSHRGGVLQHQVECLGPRSLAQIG
jgi:hypothetical protein